MDTKEVESKAEKAIRDEIAPALERTCAATAVFYGMEDGKVKVGLRTPCGNCPRAHATIKQSVEVALRTLVPEVQGVIPFYL